MKKAVSGSALARTFTGLSMLASALLAAPRAEAQTACQFTQGFQNLHASLPAVVGDCLDNVTYSATGDALQRTTKGLLAWRKADNVLAFTNGYQTWLAGPAGIMSRLNTERFSWEATSNVAGATTSRTVDPTVLALRPDDTDVGPGFVLSAEQGAGTNDYSLTIRSFNQPDEEITTQVMQFPSNAESMAALADLNAQYPTSNRVLGQPGAGFQNDGAAFVGDRSTLVESKSRLLVLWVKANYLMSVDDGTQEGFGPALVRARDVENRLEAALT